MDKITKSLLEDFQASQALTTLKESAAFERFCNFCVVSREHKETFNVEDISAGGGDDAAIDGIAIIVNGVLISTEDELDEIAKTNGFIDVTFIFAQAKTSSGFNAAEIGSFCYGVKDLFADKPSLRRNDFIKTAAGLQKAIYGKAALMTRRKPVCKLFYATTGKWQEDTNLVGRFESGKRDLEEMGLFSSVEYFPLDADRLQKLYQSTKRRVSAEFQFNDRTVLPEIEGVTEAYLGTLPANEYLKLIEDESENIQKSLFYDNVRDFQGDNEVNKEISDTLKSPQGRKRFIVLNNGVTIIAKSLRTVGNRFFIEDYQIVNGCQTSHVVHNNRTTLDGVVVPIKVIGTTDENVINAIIKGTNRQTEVKAEQLNALSEFQKKLEAYFDTFRDKKRLYYERRSMQFNAVPGVEKVRIVTMQQQIRAFSSMFLDQPHRATRSYSELLAKIGNDVFGPTHRPEPYYTSAFAQYKLEFLFRSEQLDSKYKATRYQILMLLRYQVGKKDMPAMTANKMETYCNAILDVLWDEQKAAKAFADAAKIIDKVSKGSLETDTIRTQAFTENLLRADARL